MAALGDAAPELFPEEAAPKRVAEEATPSFVSAPQPARTAPALARAGRVRTLRRSVGYGHQATAA